jgi:hypothetical protein
MQHTVSLLCFGRRERGVRRSAITYHNPRKPPARRNMQTRIALVREIRVLQIRSVVLHNSFHEREVVQ